jgi:hypothetical protein
VKRSLPAIVRVADGVYLPPGAPFPVAVTDAEDLVLLAFLRCPAMSLGKLVDESGVPHAARVLARLVAKYSGRFAAAVRRPRRKGNGGYAARVRNGGPPVVQNRASSRPSRAAHRGA